MDKEHCFRDVVEALSKEFWISNDGGNFIAPSSTAALFENWAGWAGTIP